MQVCAEETPDKEQGRRNQLVQMLRSRQCKQHPQPFQEPQFPDIFSIRMSCLTSSSHQSASSCFSDCMTLTDSVKCRFEEKLFSSSVSPPCQNIQPSIFCTHLIQLSHHCIFHKYLEKKKEQNTSSKYTNHQEAKIEAAAATFYRSGTKQPFQKTVLILKSQLSHERVKHIKRHRFSPRHNFFFLLSLSIFSTDPQKP